MRTATAVRPVWLSVQDSKDVPTCVYARERKKSAKPIAIVCLLKIEADHFRDSPSMGALDGTSTCVRARENEPPRICTIDIAYIYDTQPYVVQAHYNNQPRPISYSLKRGPQYAFKISMFMCPAVHTISHS